VPREARKDGREVAGRREGRGLASKARGGEEGLAPRPQT